MNLKKGLIVLSISLSLILAIISSVLYFGAFRENKGYRLVMQNQHSKNLSELNSRLNNISILLEKSVYVAESNKMHSFASQIYSEAELAKSALSSLPVESNTYETLNRFLSQIGNFALSVSEDVSLGNGVTENQKEQLTFLSDTAKSVSKAVENSQVKLNNKQHWTTLLENNINQVISDSALADSLTELEENISDYPTLLYDGPYSDHI